MSMHQWLKLLSLYTFSSISLYFYLLWHIPMPLLELVSLVEAMRLLCVPKYLLHYCCYPVTQKWHISHFSSVEALWLRENSVLIWFICYKNMENQCGQIQLFVVHYKGISCHNTFLDLSVPCDICISLILSNIFVDLCTFMCKRLSSLC